MESSMRQKTSIRLLLLFLVVIVLTACGSGARRADFTEQACETQGSVYWIKLESFDAVARKDAALADESTADIVERATAIVEPATLNLVFSSQGVSFHGFSTRAFAVNYKNVTYLRFADETGHQGALVIDYIDDHQRDGSDREASQESVAGLSMSCTDGLQEYLNKQGVTLAS